jgi:RND family efflux transporter MFP subunit
VKRIRVALLAALVVAAAAVVLWYALRPPTYQVAKPTRGDAADIVYATGVVEPQTWAKVSPLARARIVEICDCEGEAVEQGAVLARLDDSEEQAALSELQARQTLANTELARLLRLGERNVASLQEVDRARSEVEQLKALIAGQKAKIETLVLRSPMAGIVLRKDGEVGEIADPGSVLLWVGQPKPLIVTADINEEDIPRVATGQRVLLRSDAFPGRALEATVGIITPKGDPVTKTYRVRISLPDETPLRIGMTVDVNIVAGVSKDALLVPTAALDANAAFVVDRNGIARRRELSIGIRGETSAEVLSGIDEADRVITPFPASLADGRRVRIEG